MRIGIPKESHPTERRVAAVPETVTRLCKLGFSVVVEAGAGLGAQVPDHAYSAAGATVLGDVREVWAADLVIKVRPPGLHPQLGVDESELLPAGGKLICLLFPAQNPEIVARLASRGATVIALDRVPRTSRAQKADVLSSMANVAGYRAIVEAAHTFGSFFGGQMTAAGKTPPAQVLVIGAGVAGLAAIGAARALGAEVRAFDVRKAVADEVRSMGARFLPLEFEESGEGGGGYAKQMSDAFLEAERALFARHAPEVDIIVTTALIPGRVAPVLLTDSILASMKPGSVIVDLAAEQGGNTEGCVRDTIVERQGVRIVGYTDLPSRLPRHASRWFGANLCNLLQEMGGGDGFQWDLANDIVGPATVLHGGQAVSIAAPAPTPPKAPAAARPAPPPPSDPLGPLRPLLPILSVVAAVLVFLGVDAAPPELLSHLTVFALACFVGWQVVWNVSASLHTPLMAVTNAISAIIVVGGMHAAGADDASLAVRILGATAIFFAAINISGGFLVTRRMLAMFQRGPGTASGPRHG